MKIRITSALLCGAMLSLAASAYAGDPIPSVNVLSGKNPGSQLTPQITQICATAGGNPERYPKDPSKWWCVYPSKAADNGKLAEDRAVKAEGEGGPGTLRGDPAKPKTQPDPKAKPEN